MSEPLWCSIDYVIGTFLLMVALQAKPKSFSEIEIKRIISLSKESQETESFPA